MPRKRPPQVSGIQTVRDGERIIPASVRPDGSIRPERRVKQGYTPAEDVATYKNDRAETFRIHQYGHKEYVPPGLAKASNSEDKKKRRQSKKTGDGNAERKGNEANAVVQPMEEGVGQEDPEKKARALKKKIRQATELKERAAKGEKLEDSQLAKINHLPEFEKELAALNVQDEAES
jgi:partner of Y14 and mago protein